MAIPKKTLLSPLKIVFIVIGILVVAVAASIGIRMLQPYLTTSVRDMDQNMAVAPAAYGGGGTGFAGDMAVSREGLKLEVAQSSMPSRPPILPTPEPTPTPGTDAEDYEVTTYTTSIETRDLQATCLTFANLKQKDYIIFENSDENERGCSYTFKVANANAKEVLDLINSMDPKNLNENTYTIKRILENIESQESVLKKKAESIEKTLNEAITAYDEIAALARSTRDTESLAKLMNNKIDLIQRLTNERLQNNAQLEQIARSKVEQQDQLKYTSFHVSVIEDTFFNGRDIRESWEQAVKTFVQDINTIAQDITIGLAALLLFTVQYAIYFVILLFVAKYGWKFTKYVWKK